MVKAFRFLSSENYKSSWSYLCRLLGAAAIIQYIAPPWYILPIHWYQKQPERTCVDGTNANLFCHQFPICMLIHMILYTRILNVSYASILQSLLQLLFWYSSFYVYTLWYRMLNKILPEAFIQIETGSLETYCEAMSNFYIDAKWTIFNLHETYSWQTVHIWYAGMGAGPC